MRAKIQKSLDYNKLKEQQAKGKLLKKQLKFPLLAQIKYDGAYTVIEVSNDYKVTYHTSGGLQYKLQTKPDFEEYLKPGFYIAERIMKGGKLGTRRYTALTGPKTNQLANAHSTFKIHDYLSYDEYTKGKAVRSYVRRYQHLCAIPREYRVYNLIVRDITSLEDFLDIVVKNGYEGLVLKDPDWIWKDTKSRNIECAKYKKRPTADLLCIGVSVGNGKYEGMIGALVLEDSQGRRVQVGSGLDDNDRAADPQYFLDSVVEIEYEQILDTYIQPTFIQIRSDKTKEEID